MVIKENVGLNNGIKLTIALLILGVGLYFTNKELFMDPMLRVVVSLILPIFFMSRAALEQRKKLGGYLSFSEALQPTYLTLIIAASVFAIFYYFLLHSDYELLEIQRDIAVNSINMLEEFGAIPEENLADIKESKPEDFKPDIRALFFGIAKNFIFGFVIAAIIAAIVRREKPISE